MPEIQLPGIALGRVEHYAGAWAIQEATANLLMAAAQGPGLGAHVWRASHPQAVAQAGEQALAGYELVDGVAVIDVAGVLMKTVPSMAEGSSTVALRRQVQLATRDESVQAIVLRVDSPGGQVAGTDELAAEVARAAAAKPTVAVVEDLAASAAYWVASQARAVYANRAALVGSIGTYAVVEDWSGAAAQVGVKVHVVRAGAHKGVGTPGTEVTAEHLADMQRVVDGLNALFLAGVARGRGMDGERVGALADGRVHLATEAVGLGLVDGIKSFEEVLGELAGGETYAGPSSASAVRRVLESNAGYAQGGAQSQTEEGVAMTLPNRKSRGARASEDPEDQETAAAEDMPAEDEEDDTEEETAAAPASAPAATVAQIERACPGASAAFVLTQVKRGATVSQAKSSYIEDLRSQSRRPGQEPVGAGVKAQGAGSGDAEAEWNELVAKYKAQGMSREKAVSRANRERPELREAYVAQHNQQHGRGRRV